MRYSLTQVRQLFRLRGGRRVSFVHPAREWALGLLFGLIIFVVGIMHASLVFVSASGEAEAGASSPGGQATSPYREAEVRAVLEAYEARARAFKDMRGTLLPEVPTETEEETPEAPGGTPVAE